MEQLYRATVVYSSSSLIEIWSFSNNLAPVVGNRINLFMPSLEKILLSGTKHNDAGLLVRKCVPIPSSVFNV